MKYNDENISAWEEDSLKENQKYYHGTSTVIPINKILEAPSKTGIIREDFRKNNRNVVYVSSSLESAKRFAWKAAEKYGGDPIVYLVKPDFDTLVHRMNYEYTTYSAEVLEPVS